MKLMRTALTMVACSLLAWTLVTAAAAAQEKEQKPSLGDVARRIREQKKGQAKSARVWDNDSIPKTPNTVSVVGQAVEESPAEAAKTSEAKPPGTKAGDQTLKDVAATQAAILDAKNNLANLLTDLDLLQRQYSLDQQQFYGKPDFASDKEGKVKLDAEAAQVDAKRQEVQDEQQKIAELEQKLNELKTSQSSEKPAPPEKPEQPYPSSV
jgi:type I restriction-modification system DNA methylase subunit